MKLVEECRGVGSLASRDRVIESVHYRIRRFQAMTAAGLPVPGLHRIEGHVDLTNGPAPRELVSRELTLTLEDGRSMRVVLAGEDGRVLAEGHGPSRCLCC